MPVMTASPARSRVLPVPGRGLDSAIVFSTAAVTQATTDPVVRALVKAHPALGSLSDDERTALIRSSKIRFQKRHEVVCRLGDPIRQVILVLEGYVKLSIPLADGGEVFLDIARPGDSINEMLVLQSRAQDVDVTVLSACRLLLIEARPFREAFGGHPDGLLAILRRANERLQRTTEQLMDSRTRTAPARLAKALLRLAGLPNGGTGLLPRLSQGELSCMAGMSREIVNKYLGGWRDAGLIEMSNGTVDSVDVVAMSEIAGGEVEGAPAALFSLGCRLAGGVRA